MRFLLTISLSLLFISPAGAGPIAAAKRTVCWFERHPVATKLLAEGVAAGVHAGGLHHCRQINVELCDGQYGSAWAIYGVTTGFNLIMIPIGNNTGGRIGELSTDAGIAAQLGHGIVEWRKYAPPK